jgi:hypothetical protein
MKKEIKWTLNSGAEAVVTLSIDKKERTTRDDFMGEIKTESSPSEWTIRYDATADGRDVNGLRQPPATDNLPDGIAGKIGKLGYSQVIADKIAAAVADIVASEDWEKHLDAKAAAKAADREYYDRRRKIERAMGE